MPSVDRHLLEFEELRRASMNYQGTTFCGADAQARMGDAPKGRNLPLNSVVEDWRLATCRRCREGHATKFPRAR